MSKAAAIKPIYVDLPTVAGIVALSATTVQELVRQGQFPGPRQLSGRRVAWLVREVEEWAESRPASNLLPPPNTGAKKPRKQIAA
ncbi:AlpA family phage regulatory protein [Aromatoleum toluolicum]|uniref:AlpA family phage regulatory protein n=1 Tax=Aromatoleum toluolicum TaxID=90060 RepID=A0ABX1NGQ4_9RHOO|nr:AlpA family phage regulatory protein [Aromatoleum toluolicum]NMF98434.1 AlpA family phage regulatory protein [Aromatoleum toluolicum]